MPIQCQRIPLKPEQSKALQQWLGDPACQLFLDILEARAAEATIRAGEELSRMDREAAYSSASAEIEADKSDDYRKFIGLVLEAQKGPGQSPFNSQFDFSTLNVVIQ